MKGIFPLHLFLPFTDVLNNGINYIEVNILDLIIATVMVILISVFCEFRVKIAEDNVRVLDKREKQSREKILEMATNGKEVLADYVVLVKLLEEHFKDDVNEMYLLKKQEIGDSEISIDTYIEEIKTKYIKGV